MKKISAVIITNNEEKNIAQCLGSIQSIADEIIVMDSFSSDKTIEKCKPFGAKIFQQEFQGFGRQKQDAIAKASHEWILQIDADERVSPRLAEEIHRWKSSQPDEVAGYSILFHFYFMGKRMRFGGCAPEYHVRLFKKSHSSYKGKTIHEAITVRGAIGRLHQPILHYSYESFSEYFEKCSRYTTLIAREKYAQHKRFHLWHLLRLPGEFILRYIIKLGFLDGLPGLVYAAFSSYYALMKHVKLREIERQGRKARHKGTK